MINETTVYGELVCHNNGTKRQFNFVLLSKAFKYYLTNILEEDYLSNCITTEDKIVAYNLFNFAKECRKLSFCDDEKIYDNCYAHSCILVNEYNVARRERETEVNNPYYNYTDEIYEVLYNFVYHYNIFNKSILDSLTDLEISRMRNKR